jgi:hypothetical protein
MFKKSKIRKDFEDAFRANDEATMQNLLAENKWLLDEWNQKLNNSHSEQSLMLAALGVMEDEFANPVPVDEIAFCLRYDFKVKKETDEIIQALNDAEALGLCKKIKNTWSLTPEGAQICDDYLDSHYTSS